MNLRLFSLAAVLLGACIVSLHAQKMATPSGEAPGPWILGTVGVGLKPDKTITTTALKGLAIKVGEKGEAAVAYDLDLCRMAGAWTGKFTTPMNLMSRGEYPTAMGEVVFTMGEAPGFFPELPSLSAGGLPEGWVMQMAIKFGIQAADGAELRSEIVNTIHALATE